MKNITLFALLFCTKIMVAQTIKIDVPNVAVIEFCDASDNDPTKWNAQICWNPSQQSHDLGEAKLNLTARALAKNCSKPLKWSFRILLDTNGDGVVGDTIIKSFPFVTKPVQVKTVADTSFAKILFPLSFTLPYGKHQIEWVAKDLSGIADTLKMTFSLKDCGVPEVVCINGLAVNSMSPATATMPPAVGLWASDFLIYAFDNDTDASQLVFALRDPDINPGTGFPLNANGQPMSSLSWDCTQLGTNVVELWARDKFGNADFCTTFLILADNTNYCAPSPNLGCVFRPDSTVINGVYFMVNAIIPNPSYPDLSVFANPDSSGCFNFGTFLGLPIGADYLLSIEKNTAPPPTTLDAARLTAHLNNTIPFTNPYQFIAADVNMSGSVTSADLVDLKKMLLGTFTPLKLWRFIPKNFPLNPANPWAAAFPASILFSAMPGTENLDFIGVQIGNLTSGYPFAGEPADRAQLVDNQLLIAPNPFTDDTELTFKMTEKGVAQLEIFDQLGRLIFSEKRDFEVGNQTWNLDFSDKNERGLFFVKLMGRFRTRITRI